MLINTPETPINQKQYYNPCQITKKIEVKKEEQSEKHILHENMRHESQILV